MKQIKSNHIICFVMNKTKEKLDKRQKFIFAKIIDMLGKDNKENFNE